MSDTFINLDHELFQLLKEQLIKNDEQIALQAIQFSKLEHLLMESRLKEERGMQKRFCDSEMSLI
jgi:hypothetical protein